MLDNMVIEVIVGIGVVAGALTAIFALIERIWGPARRWLVGAISEPLAETITKPLSSRLSDVENETRVVAAKVDKLQHYTEYHLGPNGREEPLHHQVKRLQSSIDR